MLTPLLFQERRVTTVSIEVKKSQHKYVIGPKGHVLQEILASTGMWYKHLEQKKSRVG